MTDINTANGTKEATSSSPKYAMSSSTTANSSSPPSSSTQRVSPQLLTPPSSAAAVAAAAAAASGDISESRTIYKVKRFLYTLIQFGADISQETGEKVKELVFNLVVSISKGQCAYVHSKGGGRGHKAQHVPDSLFHAHGARSSTSRPDVK